MSSSSSPSPSPSSSSFDAIVVGSGPNGLSAAIVLARAGLSVLVREGASVLGGAARTVELTLPGFRHDLCSTVYALGALSPFFRSLPLADHGLEWAEPDLPMAHPLDADTAVPLHRSVERTATALGDDGGRYQRLMAPMVEEASDLMREVLAPLHLPRAPVTLARFGRRAILPASFFAQRYFREARSRALFAGLAAHAVLPLHRFGTSAFALLLGIAGHAGGWPLARGGAQSLTDALVSHLRSLGGAVELGSPVQSIEELDSARLVLLDVTPRQLLRLGHRRLPEDYRRALERYRYGPGVFKMDWALDAPIPWTSQACRRAGTVHVGGTLEEVSRAEREPWEGRSPEAPFVLVCQPTLVDPSRAPEGKHVGWAYCHVPHGSSEDLRRRIESRIESFAPGFRERILAGSALSAAAMERKNPNLVGGDIGGGASFLKQLFFRPTRHLYRTPIANVFLCSSSTPPGGGVHGMCGYFAARAALRSIGLDA